MHRLTDTREGNFSTKILDKFDAPGTNTDKQCLEIHRVEVGNQSGGSARVGWGYSFDRNAILIGDLDASVAATRIIQDLTYTSKEKGQVGNATSVRYTTGGTAGSEVVTVAGTAITVQIESGVSTATQVKAAVDAAAASALLVSVVVSGTGATAQVAVSAVNLAGGVDAYTPLNPFLTQDGSVIITSSLIIQSDTPYHSIQLNVTATSSAAILQQRYWNGSAFVVFSGTTWDTMSVSTTGQKFETFVPPSDWTPLIAGDDPVVTNGLGQGKYVWIIDLSASIAISTIDLVRLLNRVEVVANGNTMVDTIDGGKKIPYGAKVVPYVSTANAANSLIFEFSRSA